jgi:hypothetical protein
MSSTDIGYILSLALVIFIFTQIKEHPFKLVDLIRPLVIVALVAAIFLRTFPAQGNDLSFILISTIIGVVLGTSCGITTKMHNESGVVYSSVGVVAIFFWCVGVVARSVFTLYVQHGGESTVGHFSVQHQIISSGWVTALVLMALAEVVARTITLTIRAKHSTGKSLGELFAKDNSRNKIQEQT